MKKKQATNYGDYSDPRWQKKRLEAMEMADFECQCCGRKNKTLDVHHINYEQGKDVWDYSVHELECLCERCHYSKHEIIKTLRLCLSFMDFDDLSMLSDFTLSLLSVISPARTRLISQCREIAELHAKIDELEHQACMEALQ